MVVANVEVEFIISLFCVDAGALAKIAAETVHNGVFCFQGSVVRMGKDVATGGRINHKGAIHIENLLPFDLIHFVVQFIGVVGIKFGKRFQNGQCRAASVVGAIEHFHIAHKRDGTTEDFYTCGTHFSQFISQHFFKALHCFGNHWKPFGCGGFLWEHFPVFLLNNHLFVCINYQYNSLLFLIFFSCRHLLCDALGRMICTHFFYAFLRYFPVENADIQFVAHQQYQTVEKYPQHYEQQRANRAVEDIVAVETADIDLKCPRQTKKHQCCQDRPYGEEPHTLALGRGPIVYHTNNQKGEQRKNNPSTKADDEDIEVGMGNKSFGDEPSDDEFISYEQHQNGDYQSEKKKYKHQTQNIALYKRTALNALVGIIKRHKQAVHTIGSQNNRGQETNRQ